MPITLKWLDLAPRSFESPAGRRDRAVDVLGIALGNGGEQFTGRGIMCLEAFAGCGIDPFAVDQHFFVGTVGIGMARGRDGLRYVHNVPLP
jgi:hypothetical protein